MKVICLTIKSDTIIIKTENKHNLKETNNNVIVNNNLFYTPKFIKKNKEIINEIINIKYIENYVYKDFESFYIIGSILKCSSITFDIKESLSQKALNILLSNEKLKYLKCYFIPSDFVHKLANKNISIEFNNDYKFTSNFINSNDFKNLKSMYYKKVINFYREEDVFDNLEDFLRINDSLKIIHLYFYSHKSIKYLTEKLTEYKENSVNIFIHQNDFNKDSIKNDVETLKELNKKFNKDEKKIKIIYSDDFFNNNIFKDLTINVVKISLVIIMYLGFIMMISSKYHEYLAAIKIRELEMSLIENSQNQISNNIDEIDDNVVESPPIEETPPEEPVEETPKYVNYYANIPTTFDKLLSINQNTVGWIKVNNTLVNYPVLQGPYNEFYNTHDIYDKEVITGWIYMDSKNNSKELDQNTIIYGHNLKSGYMFGDLKSTANYSWYTNPNNQLITFNTLEKEMKWQIFSIYRVDYTTDYLQRNFFNGEQFMDFISLIKGRSIYNFNVDINENDKILTLSTCSGSSRRLVVHAKLVE